MHTKSFLKETLLQLVKRPIFLLLMLSSLILSFLLTRSENRPQTLRDVPAAVIDLCRDDLSREITDNLQEDSLLKIVNSFDETDPAPYLDDLLHGKIEAVFVIDGDFSDKIADGDFKGCLHAYYGGNQVSARLLTETVTASVMDICIRERSIDLLRRAYEDADLPFTAEEDARLYLAGLESAEYPIEFISLDGGESDIPAFRIVIIRCIREFLLSILLFFSCAFLSRWYEDGIFLRLKGLSRPAVLYQLTILLTASAVIFLFSCIGTSLAAPSALLKSSVSDLLTLLCASALFTLCLNLVKTRRLFLLLFPILDLGLLLIHNS